jgi:AraC-like DNA-binding protein
VASGDLIVHKTAYANDKCIDSQLLIANVIGLFKQRQLDINSLLSGTGVFIQDLNEHHKVSPIQLCQLIENAQKIWPGDDLAFLLGQHWLPNQSGMLTNGLLCCRDLSQLQSHWYKFHWQSQPWLQGWRWYTHNQQHLLFSLDIGTHTLQQFFFELTLSSLVSTYKRLSHNSWQGEFSLPYPQPKNIDQYYKYLGITLRFEQPVCIISYPIAMQSHTFDMANQHGYQQAYKLARIKAAASEYSIGLPSLIRLQLMNKDTKNHSLPDIAKQLDISPATLKRRLKEYHCRFQQLQDQAKLHQALYLLSISGQTNLAVAQHLKFADSNNFRRSFKRWTGQLPSQFKNWLAHIPS